MKIYKFFLLTISMLLCSIVVSAQSFEVNGIKYEVTSSTEMTVKVVGGRYKKVVIPSSVDYDGNSYSVTEITSNAFKGYNITSITIPESVNEIYAFSFLGCTSLKEVIFEDGSETLFLGGKNDYSEGCFFDCPLETIYLGRTLSFNSYYSEKGRPFYNKNFYKVTIGDKVTSVNNNPFSGCSVYSLIVGARVSSINHEHFSTCVKTFWKCRTLPSGYEKVKGKINYTLNSDYASTSGFKVYPYLGSMFEVDGVTYVPVSTSGERTCDVIDCRYDGSLTAANIGETVLYRNISLKVQDINPYTFYNCSTLKQIEINNQGSIGNNAFDGCNNITSFSIPKGIVSVDNYAFQSCTKLADVTIEDRIEPLTLGSNGSKAMFSDCPLNSVYVGGKLTYNAAKNNGYSPFNSNTSLAKVTFNDEEVMIYDYEFQGCSELKSVTIGHGVSTIGDYAFSDCASLEEVSFGSNVQSIGEGAFTRCTELMEINSGASVPPTCGSMALDDVNKMDCTLKIPMGSLDAYLMADQWMEFFFIEEKVEDNCYAVTYYVDGEVYYSVTLPYGADIVVPEAPTKEGYTFSGWSNLPATMPDGAIEVHATFVPSKYTVTFKANGVVVSSKSLAYGSAIVAPEAPEITDYVFVEWADLLTTVPAHDVEFVAVYKQVGMQLVDGVSSFSQYEDVLLNRITYTRNFKNTNWQALYVPFEIPLSEDFLEEFEVADLNDVRQYDRNDDGVKDDMVIEAFKVKSGVLEANYPYLIRAKVPGEKVISVTNSTLYATKEVSIDCSSIYENFTFTGTYTRIASSELPQSEGYYALSGGNWSPVKEGTSLGSFRFYLKVDNRNQNAPIANAPSIRMRIVDEYGNEEESTNVENLEFELKDSKTIVYDLQGRRVENPVGGIYIVNGKKVIWKK